MSKKITHSHSPIISTKERKTKTKRHLNISEMRNVLRLCQANLLNFDISWILSKGLKVFYSTEPTMIKLYIKKISKNDTIIQTI